MQRLASPAVGLFKRITVEDTQAECDQKEEKSSDSQILFTPLRLVGIIFKFIVILNCTLRTRSTFYMTLFQKINLLFE